MTSRDIFQALDTQEAATLEMVIARMEARAQEPRYAEMRRAYLDRLDLANARTFLDLGCGTGIDARVAAARPEFKGVASGIDASEGMIAAGLRFAAEEGVAKVFGKPPLFLREGGSIPIIADIKRVLGLDSVLMGMFLPEDNLHAPNESFNLAVMAKSIEVSQHILRRLAGLAR